MKKNETVLPLKFLSTLALLKRNDREISRKKYSDNQIRIQFTQYITVDEENPLATWLILICVTQVLVNIHILSLKVQ